MTLNVIVVEIPNRADVTPGDSNHEPSSENPETHDSLQKHSYMRHLASHRESSRFQCPRFLYHQHRDGQLWGT